MPDTLQFSLDGVRPSPASEQKESGGSKSLHKHGTERFLGPHA